MIKLTSKGDYRKVNSFLEKLREFGGSGILDKYGMLGVDALKAATPKDTGLAAESWEYSIVHEKNSASIVWSNTDVEGGCNVVLLVQYGHAKKDGTYLKGLDFINPSMKHVFEEIADSVWKEVAK